MANILVRLNDTADAEAVLAALASGKHKVSRGEGISPADDPKAVVEDLVAEKADVVILDYNQEDAASVKLMQCSTDHADRPEFVFIDSDPPMDRDHLLMAVNEGARAILPKKFSEAALVNYVERAVYGPGRLRLRAQETVASSDDLRALEEKLGSVRTRLQSMEKLVAYLLSTAPSAQARRVLIVSDSAYQVEMLKKQIEDYGFIAHTASNMEDGVATALAEKPRIIISDLELEGHTGIEFCQAVKFTNKFSPCFFVVWTANQDKLAQVMTPGNGVDDCILKPSGQSDLEEFIARTALGLLL